MNRDSPVVFFALVVTAAFLSMAAGDPAIDASKSSIVATFREESVPVDAPLKKFNGRIDYDASRPTAAKAALEVDTGSLDLGSPDYDSEVRNKEWLDSGTYPKATFISTAVKPTSPGHFDATGTLTLKGKTQTLTVPVTVSAAGKAMVYDGAFEISRAYFGIGSKEWNDEVDDKVKVRFHLLQ
ncbi:MAG TPA: YceI family protein [Steroidobacteraceae bacterium]|jgi:polyisoprenoid-binding protein YceI